LVSGRTIIQNDVSHDCRRGAPVACRRGLVLAAALYVGGAIGGEVASGLITSDVGFALATTVEEVLEMSGQLLLLWTLLNFWAPAGEIVLRPRRA
jgi:hypothetical protein